MDLKLAEIGDTQQEEEQHFHVLAVDDSHIDRKLLERLLTVSSYQVTCVDSGNKALEYLGLLDDKDNNNIIDSTTTNATSSASCSCTSPSSHSSQQEMQGSKVNLIITDYSMPGMNGYDLLRRLKGSSWKNIPVVVMSSENVPARINMCLEGGAEQFLLKPLQLSDLRKLQSHLLKPLSHSCDNLDNDIDLVDNDENENNNNNDINNNDNNNNNANKRKAMSQEDCSERRPKMKELAVV